MARSGASRGAPRAPMPALPQQVQLEELLRPSAPAAVSPERGYALTPGPLGLPSQAQPAVMVEGAGRPISRNSATAPVGGSRATAARRRRRRRPRQQGCGPHGESPAPAVAVVLPLPAAVEPRPIAAEVVEGAPAPADEEFSDARCAEMSEVLREADGAERTLVARRLTGWVLYLTLVGAPQCRLVQLALEAVGLRDATALIGELRGHVRKAIESPHGNYVIQKVIEVVPPAITAFVTEELRGIGVMIASHRYGCRIVCRLLEHSGHEHTEALIMEVLGATQELAYSLYGHHVINSILEHGTPLQRRRVVAELQGGLQRLSLHRHGSSVLERAVEYCAEEDQELLAAELLNDPAHILEMAQSAFGCHVIKALLNSPCDHEELLTSLRVHASQLQETKCAKRLLRDFGILPTASAQP